MNPANNASDDTQSIVDVQWALEEPPSADLPSEVQIHRWVDVVLKELKPRAELTVRIVEPDEITELNTQYRHKNAPTNVLSFPVDADLPLDIPLLGDLVICAEIVRREAQEQHKTLQAHWAHMLVHGTLHLLGYDHIEDDEAAIMEQKEIAYLHRLGFSNPYEVNTHS